MSEGRASVAVELRLDPGMTCRIRSIWSSLQEIYGVPVATELGAKPHITLTVFDGEEPEMLKQQLLYLSETCQAIDLAFAGVDSFPTAEGVVFLAPERSDELLALHGRFHEAIANQGPKRNPYYEPGVWRPHCTIATDVRAQLLPQIVRRAEEEFPLPPFRIERVAAVSYRPATELYSFRFQEPQDRRETLRI